MRSFLNWLLGERLRGEVVSVPTPSMREVRKQRDDLFGVLLLTDGLLSQGKVAEAQSQVRIAIVANRPPRKRPSSPPEGTP